MADPDASARPSFSGYYDKPLYRLIFRWIDRRKIATIRAVVDRLPSPAVLLDLGCGSGEILARVARSGDLAIAMELNTELLGWAASRGLTPVCASFDQPLPIADASVDAALMIDAIEHTEHPHHVLRELSRVVRPDGRVVVFTPPYDSVRWILAERFHHVVTRRPADHVAPFTRESLNWAMTRTLDDVTVGRVNWNLTMFAIGSPRPRVDADRDE